jgi:hypothetical protein
MTMLTAFAAISTCRFAGARSSAVRQEDSSRSSSTADTPTSATPVTWGL